MGRPPATRACDRCHAVKEKCRRVSGQSACERCHRLQNTCQSLRPVGTAGRKPRHHRHEGSATTLQVRRARSASSSTVSAAASSINQGTTPASPASDIVSLPTSPARSDIVSTPRTLSMFADMNERELFIIKCISQGRPQIEQFLVAPSFRVNHHKTFARHLHNAPPWIHDALIATAALLACEYDPDPSPEDRAIGHRRAASAVSTLRSVRPLDSGDLPVILLLAVSALTFALHISGSGLAICRHALLTIKPIYDSTTVLDSECSAFFVCLILSETEECYLMGEVPTLRFKMEITDGSVDRYVGIAAPMLPCMYDICEVSYLLRQDERLSDSEITGIIDAIELVVHKWMPTLPEGCASRFLQQEMVSLLAQANIFRWAVLLMIHRLRYPFGTELAAGTALSQAILEELRSAVRHTKRSIPHMEIAYMVACFELTDLKERQMALEQIDIFIEFSRRSRIRLRDQLTAFWAIKDIRGQVHWCDAVSWLPH
ncbi:hypothetical protein COCMIDRAFT_85516 [Bipolaris oryzae ATCC 44560]|uniref:Zn(2)-C6 fungal-type domain-containing protein n=1 Tax=Bipolaris oryzae ATCC 44560 TaxID=930090 RepID=W6ZZ31_COCMI|nr:uncharacterized protein COCMIDRAFT_85516 [Bipolaris oryzae ATCC 44560]EUC49006.1 hypothetical protein COCMIDRAFT_85516 [Bipolaris oryzae ATCC 44560]